MDSKRLLGQVAIVTGGGSGIGKATSLALAKEGASIVLAGRTESDLQKVKSLIEQDGGIAEVIPTDVGIEDQCIALVNKTIERFGRLDILVNNAASFVGAHKQVIELTEEEWREGYMVNVRGPYILCRESIPYLKKADRASIVNIISVGARRCYIDSGLYVSIKHALRAMTVVLSKELRKVAPQIRVHAVNPGGVRMEREKAVSLVQGRPDLVNAKLVVPAEIAELIITLVTHQGNGVIDEITMRRVDADYFCFD